MTLPSVRAASSVALLVLALRPVARAWCTIVAVTLLTVAPGAALAQDTASSINGRVVGTDGTPIEGATVLITHVPSGTNRTATTNADGRFNAAGLRVGGPFRVTATKEGFEQALLEDVVTALGVPTSLELALENPQIQEVVVAGTREREQQIGVTSAFTVQDIRELPSVSRDIKDIVRVDPKIIVDPTNSDALEIAGTNSRYNSLSVDGIRQSDDFGLNNNGYPTQRAPISLDAIEAVSVKTAPFDVRESGFQGGAINVVTKSGTNDFKGSAFYYTFRDSLVGDESKGREFNFNFNEKSYGATLGGPILRDKLFFFLSYEELERTAPVELGPTGAGFAVDVPGVSAADYNEIVGLAQTVYNFDAGALAAELPEEDRKILAKFDWQITDNQRLSLAYQNSEGNEVIQNNSSTTQRRVAAPSNWYDRSFPLEQLSLQWYATWTDNFSTEFKIGRKEVEGKQAPLQGNTFAEMQVRTSEGGTVFLGPDQFRHANELANDLDQLSFRAEYLWGDHTFSGGVDFEKLEIFNLFVPNSQGQYLFTRVDPMNPRAAIDDFRNRVATSLTYQNAITNNAEDGAASFGSKTLSFYVQDRWEVLPDLVVYGGVRFDQYDMNDVPRLNQNFVNRYGFANTETFDGKDLFSPRLGFTWDVDAATQISGGVGLFGGGSPNVWLSNSFSNDGVSISQVTVNAMSPAALQTAALTGINGFDIPTQVQQLLVAGDGAVNAISPDFEVPSSWKYNLSVLRKFDFGALGDNWRISADLVYTKVKDAVVWRDLRLVRTANAPDGRPIYSLRPGDTRTAASNDLLLGNTSRGRGLVATFGIDKTWRTDYGRFDLFLGYGYQDIKDVNSGTSSTALSNWDNLATFDVNDPALSTSNYEIKHRFPFSIAWRRALFGDFDTSAALFVERRSGRPFSYTFGAGSTVFGDPRQAARTRQLFYVPRDQNDVNLTGGLTWAALDGFISAYGLDRYRGQIAPRNAFSSPWITTADLRLSQELPAFIGDTKAVVTLDIENFANLINNDWGRLTQISFPYVSPVVDATSVAGGRYTYAPISGQTGPRQPAPSQNPVLSSVWRIQLGIKFEF